MKITISAIALMLCFGSFAQEMSEKEKKSLQKEMLAKAKGMDAVELKKMFDEYPNLSSEVSTLETKVSSLESEASEKDGRISSLQSELDAANAKIEELNNASATATTEEGGSEDSGSSESTGSSASTATRPTGEVIPGLVYKVQIGAFRNKDLTKYFNNNKNFGGEVDEDGTQKYSIGQFAEYWEADAFKKYMREMGVRDAWIVPYYNGKRVSMKDAREGVLN